MKGFIICNIHQILLGRINDDEIGSVCNTHGDIRNLYKILVARDHLGDRDIGE
jgi:hypothetical protein